MNISVEIRDEINIIGFDGNLDTSTSPEAESSINEMIENGANKFIFDLDKTAYVSSSGLRIFLSTAKKVAAASGNLVLCSCNEVVYEILEISGFNTIITVKNTLEESLMEF